MHSSLKSLFEFHPKEQKGILALTFILILSMSAYWLYDHLVIRPSRHAEISPAMYASLLEEHRIKTQSDSISDEEEQQQTTYTQKRDTWTRDRDIKYPNDFAEKREYTYVDHGNWNTYPSKPSQFARKKGLEQLEINAADTALWQQVKGIGSYTAKKIIDYRNKLGGFHSMKQLLEIYKIDPAVFDSSGTQFTCNETLIKKLYINQIEANELAQHPYITKKQAQSLVAYRNMHGPYSSLQSLRKSVLMDDATLQKITPYLTFE